MIKLDEKRKKILENALSLPQHEEKREVAEALERFLKSFERGGMQEMVELDLYFGEMNLPLEKEIAILRKHAGEAFGFFDDMLARMQEDMQIHFEETEMYEDEEFQQCERDLEEIKKQYDENLRQHHRDRMIALVHRLIDDLV